MFTHIKTLPRGSSAFLSLPRVAVSKELECYRRSLYIHKFIYTHIYTYIHLDPLKQENAQGKINKPQKQGEHPYGAAHRCLSAPRSGGPAPRSGAPVPHSIAPAPRSGAPLRFSFIHLWPVDVTQKPEKKKRKKPRKKDLQAPEHTYAPTSPLGLTPSTSHTTFIPPKGGGSYVA